MINTENAGKFAMNTKTKTAGIVVCQYARTTDGKQIVEVSLPFGRKAHWIAASTDIAR